MKKNADIRRHGKKKYNVTVLVLVFIVAICLLVAGVYYFWGEGVFYSRRNLNLQTFSPNAQMRQAISEEGFSQDEMFDRLIALLIKESDTEPFILSRYLLPGQLLSMEAQQSNQINSQDQILLARIYIARNQRRLAKNLLDEIEQTFMDDSGLLIGYVLLDYDIESSYETMMQDEIVHNGPCLEATVMYLRAMLEYYDRWGTSTDWMRIEHLADSIFDGNGFYNDIVFTPSKMSELIVGLNDYDDYLSDLDDHNTYAAFRLSSLDLLAFQTMANLDSIKYQKMYDVALEIVSNGMFSDSLPLFAFAYSESGGGYVYFMGEESHVELVSSLKVMQHLAEVDMLPPSSLAWLRQQIYNNNYLYHSYDILWGSPALTEESLCAYGLAMQIAIAEDDVFLYTHILGALARSRAVMPTSPARQMVFRQVSAQRNMVVSEDNLQVLLAMGSK